MFTSPVWRLLFSQRLMVDREIPKSSATSLLGMPRSMAESTFSLRSLEYAFMDLFSYRSATYASRCNGKIAFASSRTTGAGVDNPEGDSEIFTMNPDRTGIEQLAKNGGNDYDLAWAAQGNAIAFTSQRDDNEEI